MPSGGSRKGAGAKPKVNIDPESYKKSKEEVEAREEFKPKFDSQDYPPPASLDAEELAVWNWLVSMYRAMYQCPITDADLHTMEVYCRAYVDYEKACADIKKDPRDYQLYKTGVDKEGNPKSSLQKNPAYRRKIDAANLLLKCKSDLCLDVVSREKVGIARMQAEARRLNKDIFDSLDDRSDDD